MIYCKSLCILNSKSSCVHYSRNALLMCCLIGLFHFKRQESVFKCLATTLHENLICGNGGGRETIEGNA